MTLSSLFVGLVIGACIGAVVMAILAAGAYERGAQDMVQTIARRKR